MTRRGKAFGPCLRGDMVGLDLPYDISGAQVRLDEQRVSLSQGNRLANGGFLVRR